LRLRGALPKAANATVPVLIQVFVINTVANARARPMSQEENVIDAQSDLTDLMLMGVCLVIVMVSGP
jgi:uncharacterized membrane protein YqhA